MRLLALDTCLDACSAAVADCESGRVAGHWEAMRQGHAERLFPMLQTVLAEAGLTLDQIERIAVTIGPGTFTGTRIGIAAARGIALATGARIFCATSLSLLAASARPQLFQTERSRPLAVCLDARKGEVMLEICGPAAAAILGRPQVLTPSQAAAAIHAQVADAILIGTAGALVAQAAEDQGLQLAHALPTALPDARYLAAIALSEVAAPAPLYLRPPDAKPQIDKSLVSSP